MLLFSNWISEWKYCLCNKTLKIVVCDVTFCFFGNLDVTALKSSRKPRVAGCARMRENLVQFSSKQENKAQIITLVNNQYQNYKVSFIKLLFFVILFSKHNKLYQQTIPVIDCNVCSFGRRSGFVRPSSTIIYSFIGLRFHLS